MLKQIILLGLVIISFSVKAETIELHSGGVGLNQRESSPSASFHLILATSRGAFLAGVDVDLENSQGRSVAKINNAGPWVWGDLPAGSYRVIAKRAKTGEMQSAYFEITDRSSKTVNLVFRNLMENDL